MLNRKNPIRFTFPNLSTIPQRGNVSIRWEIANKIERKYNLNIKFDMVEVPADFIKNPREMEKTKLLVGDMLLTEKVIESIYSKETNSTNKYILHTEPSLSRKLPKNVEKKSLTPKLQWYDSNWVFNFKKYLFLLIDHFIKPPIAIEIHPGTSDHKKNNFFSFSMAIERIIKEIKERYNYNPLIMIENRTGHIIQDGENIKYFWNYFKQTYPDISDNFGIILDVQQFFTVTKSNFNNQLALIPPEAVCGAHIHTKHRAPSDNDYIPWNNVFNFLKKVNKNRGLYILPEVHNENQLIPTIKFIIDNQLF